MLSYLPRYYESSTLMRALMQVAGTEMDDLRGAIESLLNNLFVRTADAWGLDLWEAELGLAPDLELTLEERRDRAVAKLTGHGTATREQIARVAASYANGEILVEDQDNDPALVYTVRVTFIGERGIPSSLADVERSVQEVIPAHLVLEFAFTYNTWDDIDAQGWTWNQVDALALTWDQWDAMNL